MKTWHIQTCGGGTPHYLVSAETKEEAWKMVEEEWWKKYNSSFVGGYESVTRGFIYQTENDLIEVKGLTTGTKLIMDLNKFLI